MIKEVLATAIIFGTGVLTGTIISEAKKQSEYGILKRTWDTSVRITVNDGTAVGSGIYISKDIIVSACHVVEGNEEVLIREKHSHSYTGKVVLCDKKSDLAFIKTKNEKKDFNRLKCGFVRPSSEQYFSIGNQFGTPFIPKYGRVVDVDRYQYLYQSNIFQGDSGSGVVSKNGEVIGIVISTHVFADLIYTGTARLLSSKIMCDKFKQL